MAHGPTPSDQVLATRDDDIRRLEGRIAELVRLLDAVIREQKTQFTRIAQLQADLDLIRGVWTRLPSGAETTEDK